MDQSAPPILLHRVRIPSTSSTLFWLIGAADALFGFGLRKERKGWWDWPIFKRDTSCRNKFDILRSFWTILPGNIKRQNWTNPDLKNILLLCKLNTGPWIKYFIFLKWMNRGSSIKEQKSIWNRKIVFWNVQDNFGRCLDLPINSWLLESYLRESIC